MLHDFIASNRGLIIERTRRRADTHTPSTAVEWDGKVAESGIPLFLEQLTTALGSVDADHPLRVSSMTNTRQRISDTAAVHGQELLRKGFSVAQVVHGYGDVCQIVTELATERRAPIPPEDFHAFNLCLDDAIAGAVTAYGRQRERDLAHEGVERLGMLAHELRNLLNMAILSFDLIKKGTVGMSGSTGALHSRSLASLHALVERSLAEIRLEAGVPLLVRTSVADFIAEISIRGTMEAEGHGHVLTVSSVEDDVAIDIDEQLLASALSNLLQNAFKFSRPGGTVMLSVTATAERVLLSVGDECGGLPAGKSETMFRPFTRGGSDSSGLGLGLSIALSAVRANSGELHVRDVPGKGCVFTIDLPRQPPPPIAVQQRH